MDDEHSITQLTTEETLKFLSEISFGRLALSIKGHPDIFPINFAIHTRSSDHVVAYIRTSPGTKLYATAVGSPLALEADRIEGNIATSAVLYGTGRMVQHPDEFDLVDSLGLTAWVAVRKRDVIAIEVERVSGRKFRLGPSPTSTISETPD